MKSDPFMTAAHLIAAIGYVIVARLLHDHGDPLARAFTAVLLLAAMVSARSFVHAFRRDPFDLSPRQRSVLAHLQSDVDTSIPDLLGEGPGALTPVLLGCTLAELEDRAFVQRSSFGGLGGAWFYRITPLGQRALDRVLAAERSDV